MRTIIHFMGMKSTKFGGLEKFMAALIRYNSDYRFILVYDEYPVSSEYINVLYSYDALVEVVDFKSMGFIKQLNAYRRLFRKYTPDIVHFHFSLNHFGALAARLSGITRIYKTVHSCMTNNSIDIESFRQLGLRQQIGFVGGFANKLYTGILFVSDYTYNQYVKVFGPSVSYQRIYLGVEQRTIHDIIKPDDLGIIPEDFKIITTIAFAHPLKGVDVLIRAIPQIPKAVFLIIGLNDCEYTEQLKASAIRLGVNDRIRWIGIKDDVLPYLGVTDIYVQPSRTEALSLAACEALSLGIPVVGSNVGGLPEVSSILFEREDYLSMSEIINKLISDDIYLDRLSDSSKNKYEKCFRLESSVYKYSKLYKDNVNIPN